MINESGLVGVLRRKEEEQRAHLVAFSNSGRVAGWVKTLQSQQVQLGVRVVSDLMDHLEGDRLERRTSDVQRIIRELTDRV